MVPFCLYKTFRLFNIYRLRSCIRWCSEVNDESEDETSRLHDADVHSENVCGEFCYQCNTLVLKTDFSRHGIREVLMVYGHLEYFQSGMLRVPV